MRKAAVRLAAAGLAAAGIVLAGAWAAGALERGPSVARAERPVVATVTLSARESRFGDLVLADVDVVVDPRQVDPGSVRLAADTSPFTQVAPVERMRFDLGREVHLRRRFRLACLTTACLAPVAGRRPITPEPVSLVFERRRSAQRERLQLRWPPAAVVSRLTPADLVNPMLRPTRLDAAPAGARTSPRALSRLALLGSAVLVFSGLVLVAPVAARLPRSRAPTAPRSATEIALDLVAASTGRSESERRAALDHLAVVLARAARAEPAARVRTLAWEREAPSRPAIENVLAELRNGSAR